MFSTRTVVPRCAAATERDLSSPEVSKSRRVPLGASEAVAVVIWRSERAQREERASPRKPKVVMVVRSV